MPQVINETVIFRRERRQPHAIVAIVPTDEATFGNLVAIVPVFDQPLPDFSCYCTSEVSLDWLKRHTRPATEQQYGPLREYLLAR